MPSKKKTFGRIHEPEEIERILADAYMNIYVDEEKLFNPLNCVIEDCEDHPEKYIAAVMSRPEYFQFLCNEVLNLRALPFQYVILRELWQRKFPMLIGSRGLGKSFILAVYCLLRILLLPTRKIVVCGAAFRQSKIIFEYMENIWNNAPILRDIVGTNGNNGPHRSADMFRFFMNGSVTTALPIGDGQKIRGQRANDIIADEFSAMSRDIFETVIGGFGAVSANPIDNVHLAAKRKAAKKFKDLTINLDDEKKSVDNQIIIAGTAYYDFNHFAEYWKKWKSIINTRGDKRKIAEILSKGNKDNPITEEDIPNDFKWDDYSIIRIPYEMIPEGFMDAAQVARSRASIQYGTYLNEYSACFSTDSNGFFKRSLIESCCVNPDKPINFPEGPALFKAATHGDLKKKYVMGIDPAAAEDNFAIVVLEIHPTHRRVVYTWTTTNGRQKDMLEKSLTKERDYYSYCARKIRELMKRFPCAGIAIDSQGGGLPIMERLNDQDKMLPGEQFIWPMIDPEKPQESDAQAGLHLIEIVQFASQEWTNNSNHSLKVDMENKNLLFPFFDSIELALNTSYNDDTINFDTMEDCMIEIEELKNELATIVITETATGRFRWDTPEIKLPGSKKGRLRKDRYSALLMANALARRLEYFNPAPLVYSDCGAATGFGSNGGIQTTFGKVSGGNAYAGNNVLAERLNALYKRV